MKTCKRCVVSKPFSSFRVQVRNQDGTTKYYWSYCRECDPVVKREQYVKHRAKRLARCKQYREKNWAVRYAKHKVYYRRYMDERPGLQAHYVREWRKRNPERAMHQVLRRTKERPIPKWANRFFMREIYALARLRSKVTGMQWHVDHIIPLFGENVCGLHVEHNLRVVPATVNLRKNKYLEEGA